MEIHRRSNIFSDPGWVIVVNWDDMADFDKVMLQKVPKNTNYIPYTIFVHYSAIFVVTQETNIRTQIVGSQWRNKITSNLLM